MADIDQFETAYVRPTKDGHYEICARWNAAGLFRVVERLPTEDMAKLFAKQLREDDKERHRAMMETKTWDFINDAPKQKPEKRERVKREPINFTLD
jgi:hypothetical protein